MFVQNFLGYKVLEYISCLVGNPTRFRKIVIVDIIDVKALIIR